MVVETDWPTQCSGIQMSEPSIPISAAGQGTWVRCYLYLADCRWLPAAI